MIDPLKDECEACPTKGSTAMPLRLFMAMWMCQSCIDKNKALSAASEATATARVEAERGRASDVIAISSILKQAQVTDAKVEVKTDLFNAETVSIIELKKAIDEDTLVGVNEKHSRLAEMLLKRYQTYKEKIFANQNENVELANKQSSIHKYLNDLKNSLTDAERERYKLLDATYQPNKIKISNKPISSPAKPRKYDKIDILKAAQRAGVPTSVIQMICVAKNMTPTQASDSLLEAGSKPELAKE